MKKISLFICVLLVGSFYANCQDTLRLMNGKVLDVSIGTVSDTIISFKVKGSKKSSFQERTTDEIFSFKKKDQSEVLVYRYNESIGNFYQVDEMRQFILGEQHAYLYHGTIITKVSAVAVGAAAGYFVADGGGLVAASPLVYSAIMSIPGVKVRRNKHNEGLRKIEPYRAGYKRVVKGRRFLNNLAYSAMGMIGSFVLFEYTDAAK